ncbi:MAG TPA: ubiquitin-like domain-containing protein [Bellilinea sp.]|nr:ubiquitin-like domain-containing protein [Bellilinea sp.]
MPKQRLLTIISIGLIIAGAVLAYLGLERDIILVVDGLPQTVRTRALTVGGVVRQAGYSPGPNDRLTPVAATWMLGRTTARFDRAHRVELQNTADGTIQTLELVEHIPANLLAAAGILLFPGDRLMVNGTELDPYTELPVGGTTAALQFQPAVAVTVVKGDTEQTVYSSADTLYEALWQGGINLSLADRLTPAGTTRFSGPLTVEIEQAVPVTLRLADKDIHTATTAATVGELLTQAGIPLQGLDYSLPGEDQPLPDDRIVRVVRVREEIALEQKTIPFTSSYQQDNETELDTSRVITPGEYGIEVSRVRIRLEDGVETGRTAEAAWVAKEPQNQLVGYGTQAVVKTIDTPYGALEYWRAVTAFATSYSPCRLGIPNYCNTQTSSGAQLRQGIVAVTRAWYSWMRGQQVYIPGYGVAVIGDVGGGIPGRYWIDLGYTDADFKSWATNVTVYFLTPVPASIPWILP